MKRKLLPAEVVTAMLATAAATSAAQGATIAQYTFPAGPTLTATAVDPNATASSVTLGTSVNAPISTNDFWISKPVISLSRSNDTGAQVYFQATVSAAAGYELNLDSFSVDGARGGPAAPRSYEVHSSVGGLARDIDIVPAPPTSVASGAFEVQRGPVGSSDALPTITADLTAPAYNHLSSLTMRVYFYTPTTNQNIDIDNVMFNGVVAPIGSTTVSTWNVASAGDWNTSGNWSNGVPNGIDAEANFLAAINATRTVFADTPVTVGTMRFNNANMYHVTGGGSLTMQVSTGSSLVQVLGGTHKINLPLIIASNTDLNVADGATLLISDPVTVNAGKHLTQSGAGNVAFQSTVTVLSGGGVTFGSSSHLAGLDVGPTATATVAQSGGLKTIKADSLAIDSTGVLDLKDNKLITTIPAGTATGGVYDGVLGEVQRAYNFNAWDQPGLTTSMPDAVAGLTTIGIATGEQIRGLGSSDTDVFGGQTINGASTIAMYTYAGDANLDGTIDGGDYGVIDNFVQVPGASGYANGDFNYDGVIDGGDYGIIDNNIQAQGAPFPISASGIDSGVTPVPEPALAAVVLAPLSGVLLRRRQRHA